MSNPLYLIRHTRPAIAKGLCYGQSDIPLTKSFHKEAREVQDRLARCVFSKVYTSPLQRCLLLSKELNLAAQSDSRLMEMNFGEWENQPWNTIFNSPDGKRWFEEYLTTPCPGGESFMDVLVRVESFLKDLNIIPKEQCAHVGNGEHEYPKGFESPYEPEYKSRQETDHELSKAQHKNLATGQNTGQAQKKGPYCLITHAGVIRAILVILCAQNPREVFDIAIPYGHIVTITRNTFSLSSP